ncbi:MAG: sulfite exporter TauE/SafE family protein [Alphaproteobacteria bacterium]|nr:sulfite exporter TauE/SafE family protein [Alphaproteobacteria bacterium]
MLDHILALVLTQEFAIATVVTAIAGVMRGYAGFGTAIVLAPVYSILWGPVTGVPMMLAMEALIAWQLIPSVWWHINFRVVTPIVGAACVTVWLGFQLLLMIEPDALKRVIGATVFGFGVLMASGWRYHGARPLWLNGVVGAISGLLKGLTGISGPPVILYFLAGKEAAREHRANLILFFGVLSAMAILPPIWHGRMSLDIIILTAAMLPVLILFVQVGVRLFGIIDERWFRRVALTFVILVGAVALVG